jgi:hypothetical protein
MNKKLWEELLLECLAPGLVLGWIDIVCRLCGETTSHPCTDDGSNAYLCPAYGARNEV